jgi:oligopeptide transport system permease protein
MYFLKRALQLVPVLLLISLVSFSLVRAAPGGPFSTERKVSPEIERNLRAKYHLDESFARQYLRYLGGLLRGDLGPSLKYRDHSVNDVIRQALPVSMTLGLLAFLFAMGTGVPLGFAAALYRGKWTGHLGNLLALLAVCVPAFVVGPILLMLFAVRWPLFPVALWDSPSHAVLPVVSLGLYFSGKIARLTREGVSNALPSEFVRAARAKGLGDFAVLFRHVLRPAILPVVSYAGPMLADLLTGSFVVENIFQIPGLGLFMVNSSMNLDYTMITGLVLLYAALLLGLNLLADMVGAWLDPRVRYG